VIANLRAFRVVSRRRQQLTVRLPHLSVWVCCVQWRIQDFLKGGVRNVGQGSRWTSYSTGLLCVCQYSDYDAFKYRVRLGANKLETETDKLCLYQTNDALETNLVNAKGRAVAPALPHPLWIRHCVCLFCERRMQRTVCVSCGSNKIIKTSDQSEVFLLLFRQQAEASVRLTFVLGRLSLLSLRGR